MFCTAWDFEVELIWTKQPLMTNVLLSESHFLDLISPWKRQLLQLCVFSKTSNWWKEWKKKEQFPIKTFEKNQILKQVFNNASDFESRNSKYVRILVKSTQLVIFWIGNFTVCHILKYPFLPHVRFWAEILKTQQIFTWNSFWKIKCPMTIGSQKNYYFLVTLHLKNVKNRIFSHSWEACFWERWFCNKNILWIEKTEKSQYLNQLFHNATDFETKKITSC